MRNEELIASVESDILRYTDPKLYSDHLKQVAKELRNDFNRSIKGMRTSQVYKDQFERMLTDYQRKVIIAHNYFVDNDGRCQEQPSGRWAYALPTEAQRSAFTQLRNNARASRISLNNYQIQAGSRTQDVILEDDLRKDKRNEAIKTGLKRTAGVGLAIAGVGAALYAGTKAAEKIGNSFDQEDTSQPRNEHRISQKEIKQYARDYGQAQHGWTMNGAETVATTLAAQRSQQRNQTFVETEDIHEITEEYSTPQPAVEEVIEEVHVPTPQPRVTRKIVHTPAPQPVVHETIEEIQEEVAQNTVVYQNTMSPRSVTSVRSTQVVQPVVVQDRSVELATVNGLSNIGVAAVNAWGDAKVAKYMSRKGPDVVSITRIDDHSIRGSYNDNSSRVSKTTTIDASSRTYAPTNIQANRKTTVDASSRTYAPKTTTVDSSSRTYSPRTTTVDASSRTSTRTSTSTRTTTNTSTRTSVNTNTNNGHVGSIRGTMTQGSQRGAQSMRGASSARGTTTSALTPTSARSSSSRTAASSRSSNQGGRNSGSSFRTSQTNFRGTSSSARGSRR